MCSTEKIRIAYAGSDTYNKLTSGSRFCNRVENPEGNHSQRGFLGGALYNENWEPTDGFCFRDFSAEGLVVGDLASDKTESKPQAKNSGSSEGSKDALFKALSSALEWNPDFLLLQINPRLESNPKDYGRVMIDLACKIKQELPQCRLYLISPLPAGIPSCGPVVERGCELAGSFNEALKAAFQNAEPENLRGTNFVDLLAALDAGEWQVLLSGAGNLDSGQGNPEAGQVKAAQWKLAQALLFGFFEEAEQLVFPDKAPSSPGEVVLVSPAASGQGLPPSCDSSQGLIRDLPEGWWTQQLETGRRLGKKCQLIFVGDSITHWWTMTSHIDDTYTAAGIRAFRRFFGEYEDTTLNLGQASDTTADVLLRIREGALGEKPETFNPKLISILIGTNNIGNPNLQNQFGGPDNSRQLAQGILQVVREVKKYCPHSKIVVTGILPTRIPYDMTRAKMEYANYLVSKQSASLDFSYLDMSHHMTNEDGSTIPELYNKAEWEAARLHLCEAGYERWAAQLVKFLDD